MAEFGLRKVFSFQGRQRVQRIRDPSLLRRLDGAVYLFVELYPAFASNARPCRERLGPRLGDGDVLGPGFREVLFHVHESSDRVRPRGIGRWMGERLDLVPGRRGNGRSCRRQAVDRFDRPLAPLLDNVRDAAVEVVQERAGLQLHPLPVGATHQLVQLPGPLGDLRQRNPETLELSDALVRLLLEDLTGLALSLEFFRLFLKDAGQPGRRDGTHPTRS